MCQILKICFRDKFICDDLLNVITTNNNMKIIYNIAKGNINIVKSMLNKSGSCPFICYSVARLKNDNINESKDYFS